MMTNTYAPVVGGLERSVQQFTENYRRRGHRTVVVAPVFPGTRRGEKDVVRLPAVSRPKANFSIQVPAPGLLSKALRGFRPDIVHSHHPFLMGSTALRLAYAGNLPLVFTHHTLFEYYTHLLPLDSPATKRFVVRLAVGYANLCDAVFSPSRSVKELLARRGVRVPIIVVPTGIELEPYRRGDRDRGRKVLGLGPEDLVVGHVGRLCPEKNLEFLARAAALFLRRNRTAHFLLVGEGSSRADLERVFHRWGVEDRLHCPGTLQGRALVDAYHAMDLFAFTSKSETQGLVLLEAMAGGTPVAALRAPGAVDLVRDGRNGLLLKRESVEEFASALSQFARLPAARRRQMGQEAAKTASLFSMDRCAERALETYEKVRQQRRARRPLAGSGWGRATRWIRAEWELVRNYTGAAGTALIRTGSRRNAGPD